MNPKVAARQARLLRMLESKQEIGSGASKTVPCPWPNWCDSGGSSGGAQGLSSRPHRRGVPPQGGGHHWCLKRRRHDSLVANVDGRTAFLTELERRREIEALRGCTPPFWPTWSVPVLARPGRRAGLPWLRGVPVHELNERNLAQMLAVQAELAHWGWFDWDRAPATCSTMASRSACSTLATCGPLTPAMSSTPTASPIPHFTCRAAGDPHPLGPVARQADPLPQFRYWRGLCINWAQRGCNI